MKLHLDQTDLFKAVRLFIEDEGISLSGREIDIEMKAGRGDRGHYADIRIRKDGVEATSEDPFIDDGADKEVAAEPDPDDTALNFD